jgi:hypothetical protein
MKTHCLMSIKVASDPCECLIFKEPLISQSFIKDEAQWWGDEVRDSLIYFFVPLPRVPILSKKRMKKSLRSVQVAMPRLKHVR